MLRFSRRTRCRHCCFQTSSSLQNDRRRLFQTTLCNAVGPCQPWVAMACRLHAPHSAIDFVFFLGLLASSLSKFFSFAASMFVIPGSCLCLCGFFSYTPIQHPACEQGVQCVSSLCVLDPPARFCTVVHELPVHTIKPLCDWGCPPSPPGHYVVGHAEA